jgi:hypothetical protein
MTSYCYHHLTTTTRMLCYFLLLDNYYSHEEIKLWIRKKFAKHSGSGSQMTPSCKLPVIFRQLNSQQQSFQSYNSWSGLLWLTVAGPKWTCHLVVYSVVDLFDDPLRPHVIDTSLDSKCMLSHRPNDRPRIEHKSSKQYIHVPMTTTGLDVKLSHNSEPG